MAAESRAGLWAVSMVLVSFKISTYVLGVGTDRAPAGLILRESLGFRTALILDKVAPAQGPCLPVLNIRG